MTLTPCSPAVCHAPEAVLIVASPCGRDNVPCGLERRRETPPRIPVRGRTLPWSDPSSCKRPLRARTRAVARVTARSIEYRKFRHPFKYETELFCRVETGVKFQNWPRARRSCPQEIRARLVGRAREATIGSVLGARKRCGDGRTQTAGTPNLVVGETRLETCRTKGTTWCGPGPCPGSASQSRLHIAERCRWLKR